MSKILPAICVAQIVTTEPIVSLYQPSLPMPPILPTPAFPLLGAVILSQGIGPSTGVAVIDEDNSFYIADISGDLKTLLEKVISLLTNLTTALTLIDAKPTGGTGSAPTPVAATNITNLTTIAGELTALEAILK